MVVARKIAYNVVFNTIAKVFSTALALVSMGFITRYLGKDGFGNYATVLAVFAFFSAIADLGLYYIAAREISRAGADEEKIIGNVFSLRLISSLVVFLLAFIIIAFFPYSGEVKKGIIIVALSFVFSSSYMVLNGIFQKNLAMDRVAIVELLGKIIQVGIIIVAVKSNWGFTAIILSLLAYMVFNFTLILFLSRRYLRFKLRFDFAYWKIFLKESLPVGAAGIITFLYFKLDTILLSLLQSSADVGTYSAAYKIIENLTFYPAMVAGLILPLLSRYIFTDRVQFENIADKTFKVLLVTIIPIALATFFLADGIIGIIGGADFVESAPVLQILVFALFFIFFGNFFNNILIVANQQKKMMVLLGVCAIFNILANLILIPLYSYKAAAVVSVATEALVVILAIILIRKEVKYFPKIHYGGRIAVTALVMGAFLYFSSPFNFFLRAAGSVAVYGLFLWLTKAVAKEEFAAIFSRRVAEPASLSSEI